MLRKRPWQEPSMEPHQVWQELLQPGSEGSLDAHTYASALPDGRRIVLPIRVLPGGTDRAVASLILNQASFAVLDAAADALSEALMALRPEVGGFRPWACPSRRVWPAALATRGLCRSRTAANSGMTMHSRSSLPPSRHRIRRIGS